MELRHLGYVGQNLTLGLTTGRTLRLANLSNERVEGVVEANLADLEAILRWNVEQGIRFFRIGSSLIPFASHEDFRLDWRSRFSDRLSEIREFVANEGIRLSTHPGQYTVLNSPKPKVVSAAVRELDYHGQLLAEIAPEGGSITLHVGGAYGDKDSAVESFATNFQLLDGQVRSRLTIENDDTTFDIETVLELCSRLAIPAVFDFLHHHCNPPSDTNIRPLPALLDDVAASWGTRVPKFHLSTLREGGRCSHADYVSGGDFLYALDTLARLRPHEPFDLMVEAKAKEAALLRLQELAQSHQGPTHSWRAG